MRVLITGSAGFIGSHLCERLMDLGHEVVGLDMRKVENPKHLTYRLDISTAALPRALNVDWVFHLAALADIVPSIEKPWSYHQTNVTGTVRLLEWSRRQGVKRFIYAASSSCYGIPSELPTPESAKCKPEYPYAVTKYLGEKYVKSWDQIYGLETVSLRLANVYGPRARTTGAYGAVFGVFLAQLANGMPLTVVGDGSQQRDFVYVSDVVEAFVAAAKSSVSGIFNIGSDGSQSVNQLVKYLGSPPTIHIPKRPGEPDATCLNITKAMDQLCWYPAVSFETGVGYMKAEIPNYKQAPLWNPSSIETATASWFKHLGDKS